MKTLLVFLLAVGSLQLCSGQQVFNPPVRWQSGTSAPSSSDCDAVGELGGIYLQTGNPASVRTQNFSCVQTGASSYGWMPFYGKVQTTATATCSIGDLWFDSDATAGSNLYGCTSANTWTALGGGGGGPTPGTGILVTGTTVSIDPTYVAGLGLSNTFTSANDFSAATVTLPSSAIPAIALTAGTSVTLTQNNRYFVCTTTCTITVPVPAAGVQYCVFNDNNVSTVITMAAIGSSARYENTARTAYGTAGTGTFISGGAVGDFVCIVGRDSTHYFTPSFKGTWTAN